MTRFEKELSGALGAYWKKSAEKGLGRVGIVNSLQRMNMFFENGIRFEISGRENGHGTIIRISGKDLKGILMKHEGQV